MPLPGICILVAGRRSFVHMSFIHRAALNGSNKSPTDASLLLYVVGLDVVGGQGSARKITRLNFCFILTEWNGREETRDTKDTQKSICILCLFYCSSLPF